MNLLNNVKEKIEFRKGLNAFKQLNAKRKMFAEML